MTLVRRLRIGLALGAATAVLVTVLTSFSSAATSLGGSQGVNPQLPPDPASQVTVSGRGAYKNMKITVSQTQHLVNQAINVSWTGAPPTLSPNVNYFNGVVHDNFVAILECWGDATDLPGSGNPGPPPSQCEAGASATSSKPYPVDQSITTPPDSATRILDESPSSPTYVQDQQAGGVVDPASKAVFEPFRSVDGTLFNVPESIQARDNPNLGYQFWDRNMPFSSSNTNEIDFAHTYSDGTGSELFQVDTGLEASGLGCAQHSQPEPGGSMVVPQCWLVIVPQPAIQNSPLKPEAWQNRIAIPLGFNPVDSSCPIGANVRSMEGGEMASLAIHSWQPTLCTKPGLPPYNYTVLSDGQARQDLSLGSTTGSATMSVVSLPGATTDGSTPVWAPLTLSGLEIGFNIDRKSRLQGSGYYPDEIPYIGSRVATIHLTPRLVAKLLTESYLGEFPVLNPSNPPPGYGWLVDPATQHQNPINVAEDPDFVQFNPEFAELQTGFVIKASQAIVELGSSDATSLLWQWILTDPEAAAWLAGSPDQWGMRVNPLYSTNPRLNPTGAAFGNPAPDRFPKSDPYCESLEGVPLVNGQPPDPACMLNWSPYALNMTTAAQEARTTDDGSKTSYPTNNQYVTPSNYWQADGSQPTGQQFMLAVADTASAARYGLQAASLSQAGDDRPDRNFVEPLPNNLIAGYQAMSPSQQVPGTLVPNVGNGSTDAYPLSLLSYAAVVPGELDSSARHDYAQFITYAAGAGQSPGNLFGQLPPGYVPLPDSLRQQALAAAAAILAAPSSKSPNSAGPATTGKPVAPTAAGGAGQSGLPSSTSVAPPTTTIVAPTTTAAPQLIQEAQANVQRRTPPTPVGFVRFGLPIGAAVGVIASLAAPLTGRRKRHQGI